MLPQTDPNIPWKKIYLFILAFNGALIVIFYLITLIFNHK